MKNFIKDTWVLALALIIGGVIVFNNASETQTAQDPEKKDTKTVVKQDKKVDTKKATPKADNKELVLYRNDSKVLYDNDSEFAPVTLNDSVDLPQGGDLGAPTFDLAKSDYKIPTVIEKREYKADHYVAQSAQWVNTDPKSKTATSTVKPNTTYKVAAIPTPIVSTPQTAEVQVVTTTITVDTIPEYLMPTPIAFDVPTTESL